MTHHLLLKPPHTNHSQFHLNKRVFPVNGSAHDILMTPDGLHARRQTCDPSPEAARHIMLPVEPSDGVKRGVGWKDTVSMALLLLLYMLQGIPMGLCSSIPMILMERGASYESLSLFSLVSLPFSMKIVWAPLVDTYFIPSVGRRKTWLVPVQLLTGALMILGSSSVSSWLNESDHDLLASPTFHGTTSTSFNETDPAAAPMQSEVSTPGVEILPLTVFFFILYFLMATQDIAVDGWALTMLSKENVGYASIANAIGQTFGVFLANQGFLVLSDAQWCQRFLGTPALVTLPSFMGFWGYVFIGTTLLVWFLKKEEPDRDAPEATGNLTETIAQITTICRLRTVASLCMVLFTCKAAFAPFDAAFLFKLQEYGLRKTDLSTISPVLLVTSLLFPVVASNFVASQPLSMLAFGIKCKLCACAGLWMVFQLTAHLAHDREPPSSPLYFALLVVAMLANDCAGNLVFISCMSFFSRVSDPAIGGSYMTLLNTVANLGSKWPAVMSLYMLPKLTLYAAAAGEAAAAADSPTVVLDGLTVLFVAGLVVGGVWLRVFGPTLLALQQAPMSEWMVNHVEKQT